MSEPNYSEIRYCKTCGRYVNEHEANMETGDCVYCEPTCPVCEKRIGNNDLIQAPLVGSYPVREAPITDYHEECYRKLVG